MDNIRHSIEIIFKKKNPETIIQKYFGLKEAKDFDRDLFSSTYSHERPHLYNKDEISNVSDLLESKWKKLEYVKKDNVFNVLVNFTNEILTEEKGNPICKFEKLLKWRELSYELGEDILTTSYFAYKDYVHNYDRTIFAWKPIVGTDNNKLKELLSKGTAENHFHLKGSSPHFQLTWISLMNQVLNRGEEFSKLEKDLMLEPDTKYSFKEDLLSTRTLVKKAAYIRYMMFSLINEIKLEDKEKKPKVNIDLLLSKNDSELNFYLSDLQQEINYLKYEFGKEYSGEIPDYAIPKSISDNNYNYKDREYNGNILLYGERHLIYSFLKKIYSGDKLIWKYKDLFHAYLIIKEKMRNEIIQVNDRVGFSNFSEYQNRKGHFLSGIYKEAVINTAINSSKYDQSIVSLEARIGPENSMEELRKSIKDMDKSIASEKFLDTNRDINLELEEKISGKKDKENKHFYVIHFIKNGETYRDAEKNKKNSYGDYVRPLNCEERKNVEVQSKAIVALRKTSSKARNRIYGIDTANFEIGCRPEVFSQGFRYLRQSHIKNKFENFGVAENFNLGITNHAGEDFLDIVDGLRAIDETMRFLNYEQGDRLGHALALGIDPKEYYKCKNLSLIKNKQVHLDDIVWILAKVREYDLDVSQRILSHLENDFYRLFHEIFDVALKNGKDKEINGNHYDYYSAWKLRGDNPVFYMEGKYENKGVLSFWEKCGIDDTRKDELTNIRGNKTCCEIYKNYHYNPVVRLKGLESEVVKISSEYIDLVEKLQKGLQKEVAKKNISIETNPTSNYVIGTFKRYSEHPIKKFFNLGLTADYKEIKDCPQISVSINTDDQGVFPTYLENEYALMALALEKEKDEDGNTKYQPMMVYDWLDKIRQMGLEQSFMRRKK
ncbi:MAG: hypothetical protein WBG30_05355 [Psychrilyobacter sp.]|uniref:hypothetical protein n=1 Tax=Psychrilyobacter sp. TaxID=2586924 RepID=UPI003C788F39